MNSRPTLHLLCAAFILCTVKVFAQKQGQARLDSLKSELPKLNNDTIKVYMLSEICFRYHLINPDEGLKYGETGLKLAEKMKWQKGIGNIVNSIGVNYYAKSNFPKALENYIRSLEINEQIGEKKEASRNLTNIGIVYHEQSNYDKALEYYLKALKMSEELGLKKESANNLMNVGSAYVEKKDYKKALAYDLRALKLFEELGEQSSIGYAFMNIGVIYRGQADYSRALEYFFKALGVCRESGNRAGTGKNHSYIGDIYFSIATDSNKQLLENLFTGNRNKAVSEAKKHLDSSISIFKELGDLSSLQFGLMTMSKAQEDLGDYKGALSNYKQYSEAKDSVFNTENEKKITELQMRYEFDKRQAEAKAVQEKQRLIQNSIYSGLGIIVLFLVVLLVQRNRIANERRAIALEQERIRISRDLHDDLGSGLTGILMMSEQLQLSSSGELNNNNIEKIKRSSRGLVDQMGEIVWAMNSKNDTLENLICYLNTYTRDYLENSSVDLEINMPGTIPHAVMSGMKRRNIFLVVKESLNNLAKYADATKVKLQVEEDGRQMKIHLSDNGKGFEIAETRRFGNGLRNMASRMKDVKGDFLVESKVGEGTRTMISFPLS
jgi:two-component system, NarL family, sensor histidine kinase UhpB